jgi:hypothetical protein
VSSEEATAAERRSPRGRLRPADGVLSRRILDEVLVLRLEDEEYFGLRGVGRRVWELVLARRSETGVVDALVEEFAVDREVLERDVASFLAHLLGDALVTVESEEAP